MTFWNREAQALYGYSREEAIGQITHELLGTAFPESREAVEDALAHHGHWEGDLRHTRKDGTEITVASRQAMQHDADGRPIAIIQLNSDVTEQRAAEQHVRELNRDLDSRAAALEAANAELESFSYSVAHDLRAPLRAIAGFSDLLARDGHLRDDDHAGRALLARSTAAAGRMGELIDALLALAQISRCELTITRLDLTAIAAEIAGDLRTEGQGRTANFVIEPGLAAHGDARLARILLRCLLENAWKYSATQEHARIEVASAGPGTFVVADNGAGFDMAYADQLFRPFGRLHRQDEFAGTGIGLATAERIVRRHGGSLRGEGRVGHGAAFSFSLQPDPQDRS